MPQRRNEECSMIRSEPFAYRAAYTSENNVEYEGWAAPGTATSAAFWIVCKHTYSSGNLTATEWAQTTPVAPATFNQVWDDRASLTYV